MASNDPSLVLRVTKPTVFKMRLAPLESLAPHEKMPKDPCRIPIHSYAYSIPGEDLQNHFKVAFNGPILGSSVWYVDRDASSIEPLQAPPAPPSPSPAPVPTDSSQSNTQPPPAPPKPQPSPAPSPAPKPAAPPLVLRITRPTVLIRRVAPLDSLPPAEKISKDPCRIPLHSYAYSVPGENLQGYLKVAFFGPVNGASVWYVPKADSLIEDPQAPPTPAPRPVPTPAPTPAPTPVPSSGRRHINQAGLSLVKNFEGFREAAYRCPAGVATIGYGTTSGVKMGDRITRQQGEELLKRDLEKFERAVSSAVKVPINDNQFSALVCFTYNVGYGALQKSTLLKYLNQGNYEAAAREFMKWNRGGGRVLPGLTRRRQAEQALFLKKG